MHYLSEGAYLILRKTPGFDLEKVLKLYMPQFQWLVANIVEELEEAAIEDQGPEGQMSKEEMQHEEDVLEKEEGKLND